MLTKVCTKCGVEKSVDCFSKQKGCSYGVKYECKVCDKQYKAQYYKANKAAIAEQHKAYYEANKNPFIQRSKAHREAYREAVAEQQKAYYQANKEAIAERQKVYRKNNLHLINASGAKRKAAKLQATPSWTNKEHIESLYLIAAINRQGGYNLHVDHIVPLQSDTVCGLHCEANLQLLYASDNISKGNRHWPDMW
jgi:hypothetical protein